ncbi:MAG: type II toxin-antitoxin system Phd/YefM family antitoxin [Patescibacteria group bacterium]
MNKQNTFSITEARKNFFDLVEKASRAGGRFWLTDRGKPKAVLMSADEFDSWQETMAVKAEFPNILKDIKQAQEDYKKGNYITLEQLMEEQGFVVAEKSKNKYEASSHNHRKSAKKSR